MRGRWSWSGASLCVAVLTAAVLVALPPPAWAATVVDREVLHEIRTDGSILEHTRLRVRLESRADLSAWSDYAIYLDEHRDLEQVDAQVVPAAGGSPTVLKKRDQDAMEAAGLGELHSSARYHVLRFPPEHLQPGAVLEIDHRVRVAPYFPGGAVGVLGGDDPVAALSIEVTGAPEGFRWHLEGADVGVRVTATGSGLRVVGEDLEPPDELEHAPAGAVRPVLRYAWGPATSWDDVGRWYQGLLEDLPPPSETVRQRARELIRGVEDPRERLERLLSYASQNVRYVAVEVGVGGFRPAPAETTLERGWGDCKDKSTLLVQLLAEAGLEAHPALILSASDERIDPSFPSPFVFNHMIVAVAAEGLAVEPTDPVSEGFLFVDPTHDRGTSRWLHGAVQNQHALVVGEAESKLVPTPALFATNLRDLAVELTLDRAGAARGSAELTLLGEGGSRIQELLAVAEEERLEEVARSVFSALLPGVEVANLEWGFDGGGVPRGRLRADVTLTGLIPTSGKKPSFQLPGLSGMPSTSILDDRTVPVVLDAGEARELWSVTLPREGCAPATDDVALATPVGSYHQSMSVESRQLTVKRRLVVADRWIEPERFDAFRELSLAENRAKKRRLRLACE